MNARTVIGIIFGFVSWWTVLLLSLAVMALLWPAFGKAGRSFQELRDTSGLTTGMLVAILGMYVYINGIAGWITAKITGRRSAVWILGAPLFAYAVYQHLHALWDVLPAWYNLCVIGFIYPFSFLGGSLVRTRRVVAA